MQKKKRTKHKQTKEPVKQKSKFMDEIKGFVLAFLGAFLLYTCFSVSAGVFGDMLDGFLTLMTGTFGKVLLSLAVFIQGIALLFKFRLFTQNRTGIFLYICVAVFSIGSSLIGIGAYDNYGVFSSEFYTLIHKDPTPGGLLGSGIAKILAELFSPFGAWLLLILSMIIAFILIFRKSISGYIQNRASKVKEIGEEKVHEIKEKKQQKRAEGKFPENPSFIISGEKANPPETDSEGEQQNLKEKKQHARLFDMKNSFLGHEENKSKEPQRQEDSFAPPSFIMKETQNNPSPREEEVFVFEGEESADSRVSETDVDEPVHTKQEENLSFTVKEETREVPKAVEEVDRQNESKDEYIFPSVSLLNLETEQSSPAEKKEVAQNATLLEKTLSDFGITSHVTEVCMGPTVTRYELQLRAGTRVSKVVSLSDDIAMSLAAQRVRIEAPIPGKSAIGIEVPNKKVSIVRLSEILRSEEFQKQSSPLCVALGKKLSGEMLVMDIKKLPHLLIAGATGSGKSVCINAIIMSVLYHSSPKDVRLILIDPKMVELNVYNEIPHLLIPVVTDPKLASGALNWAVCEMMKRYEAFAENKVRDIEGYNEKKEERGEEKFPHIVLIIDELSDLMMVSAQQVENSICRLAQLARAAGIHLILATQRPSVNVITGIIKANIPSRISFAVSSHIDSRTILDMSGAEKLLGKGDMLYYPSWLGKPLRAQCAYVSDKEVERVVDFIKSTQKAEYDEEVIEGIQTANDEKNISSGGGEYQDELLPKAMEIAFEKGQISTSTVQRRLRLGYARAGRIIDEMEELGYITPPEGSKPRKLLITEAEFYQAGESEAE